MLSSWAAILVQALLIASAAARFVIYADQWHPTRPIDPAIRYGITHIVLAFAPANNTAGYQPYVPISTIRSEFPNAKVMVAIGGWGDDIGFAEVSVTKEAIRAFAQNVAAMLTNTGADGVDIDWEYPGGNGADYKQVPNSARTYQIAAYPYLLAAVRDAIGDKILSIAVPGKPGDMIAFTQRTGPLIWRSVDYINIMSYDLMNRRDTRTQHHTSVGGATRAVRNYLAIGAPPEKINLGFAFYAKFFLTARDCSRSPLNCPIQLAEDPVTGKDLLTSGAWTFEKSHMEPVDPSTIQLSTDGTCGPEKNTRCPSSCCSQYGNCGNSPEHCSGACQHAFGVGCTDPDVAGSWQKAMRNGKTDERAGGQYYYDRQNSLFWTWDTPELISRKFNTIVRRYQLGGVMAWSLGEDSYDWSHVRQMAREMSRIKYLRPSRNPTHRPAHRLHHRPQRRPAGRPAPRPAFISDTQSQNLVPPQPAQNSIPETPSQPLPAQDTPAADSIVEEDLGSPAGTIVAEEPPSVSPEAAEPSPSPPYEVVWVDGTPSGPETPFSTEPGAPADFVVTPENEAPVVPVPISTVGSVVPAASPVLPAAEVMSEPPQEGQEPQEQQSEEQSNPVLMTGPPYPTNSTTSADALDPSTEAAPLESATSDKLELQPDRLEEPQQPQDYTSPSDILYTPESSAPLDEVTQVPSSPALPSPPLESGLEIPQEESQQQPQEVPTPPSEEASTAPTSSTPTDDLPFSPELAALLAQSSQNASSATEQEERVLVVPADELMADQGNQVVPEQILPVEVGVEAGPVDQESPVQVVPADELEAAQEPVPQVTDEIVPAEPIETIQQPDPAFPPQPAEPVVIFTADELMAEAGETQVQKPPTAPESSVEEPLELSGLASDDSAALPLVNATGAETPVVSNGTLTRKYCRRKRGKRTGTVGV